MVAPFGFMCFNASVHSTTLEDVYKKLSNGKPENILPYLIKLNPTNALEADIAREYVSNLDNDLITKHKELNIIKEILKSGAKYPMVKLKDYLILNENKIKPNKAPDVNYKVLGVSNEIGIFLNEKLQAEETNQSYFVVAKNEFCYNPYRINVGSIGLNTFDYDNQIISGAYVVFATKEEELNSKYLDALFNSKGFLAYVNDKANGGVRMNMKFEDMEAWEIPLPSLDEQNAIVAQIEKQKVIVEGAEKVLKNWKIDLADWIIGAELNLIGDALIDTKNGWSPVCKGGDQIVLSISCLQNGSIDFSKVKYTDQTRSDIVKFYIKKGDFFYSRGNTKELVAMSAIAKTEEENIVFPDLLTKVIFNTEMILPEFAVLCFNSRLGREYFGSVPEGASPSMVKVSQGYMSNFKVPYLNDIETQRQIVSELDAQMQILEGLRKMKTEAEKKINQILSDVWGVEFVEPIVEQAVEEEIN